MDKFFLDRLTSCPESPEVQTTERGPLLVFTVFKAPSAQKTLNACNFVIKHVRAKTSLNSYLPKFVEKGENAKGAEIDRNKCCLLTICSLAADFDTS